MSATNTTTHYNLPLFEATDKPTWLGDWNGAMTALDSAIYEASQTGSGESGKAEEALEKANQAIQQATEAQSQAATALSTATAAQTAVTNLTTDVTENATEIESLKTTVATMQTTLQTATANITTLQQSVTAVDTKATTASTNAQNALTKATNAETQAASALSTANRAKTTAESAQSTATAAQNGVNTVQNTVAKIDTTGIISGYVNRVIFPFYIPSYTGFINGGISAYGTFCVQGGNPSTFQITVAFNLNLKVTADINSGGAIFNGYSSLSPSKYPQIEPMNISTIVDCATVGGERRSLNITLTMSSQQALYIEVKAEGGIFNRDILWGSCAVNLNFVNNEWILS